jgi:hypothetical protein
LPRIPEALGPRLSPGTDACRRDSSRGLRWGERNPGTWAWGQERGSGAGGLKTPGGKDAGKTSQRCHWRWLGGPPGFQEPRGPRPASPRSRGAPPERLPPRGQAGPGRSSQGPGAKGQEGRPRPGPLGPLRQRSVPRRKPLRSAEEPCRKNGGSPGEDLPGGHGDRGDDAGQGSEEGQADGGGSEPRDRSPPAGRSTQSRRASCGPSWRENLPPPRGCGKPGVLASRCARGLEGGEALGWIRREGEVRGQKGEVPGGGLHPPAITLQ